MPKTSPQAATKPAAAKAPAKGDHVFLVDGSSYIFRAYHALPPLNRKSDGLQLIREMPWNAKIPAHPVPKAVNRRKNP